jgi:hypothetical protein
MPALLHLQLCQLKVTTQRKSAAYALKYAKLVQKSVKNTLIWIIANNVLRYVASVQKNVAEFQSNKL